MPLMSALFHERNFAGARDLAEARLKIFADDPTAIRALAGTAQFEGDHKAERAIWARLEKLGIGTGEDLNGLIWGSLLEGTTGLAGYARVVVDRGAGRTFLKPPRGIRPGEDMGEYCRTANLSIENCLQLFRKVCSAVAYAHRRLVIRR